MIKNVEKLLRRYDPQLRLRKTIEGAKELIRQSPFQRNRQHPVMTIKNRFLGSGRWIRFYLQSNDSRKRDFVQWTIRHNENLKKRANTFDRDMHREVARFIEENEKILL